MRVVLRSVMTFPQFWLLPVAKRFEETPVFFATGAEDALWVVVGFRAGFAFGAS